MSCGADSDALGRLNHPLENPVIVDGAVAVPGGNTARQDALNDASVKGVFHRPKYQLSHHIKEQPLN
jgi:hypothetical protein